MSHRSGIGFPGIVPGPLPLQKAKDVIKSDPRDRRFRNEGKISYL